MDFDLTDPEARVLGVLIEKDMATPEYYPLSLNALINACNQKSNRDPVVDYDENTVSEAIEGLRSKGLLYYTTGSRVTKYGHRIGDKLNLGNREMAILAVLLLRGPQTPGELRQRASSLYNIEDLEAVDACLRRLSEWESGALATELPRQPGTRETRWAHLMGVSRPEAAGPAAYAEPSRRDSLTERVERLEAEVAELRAELERLKQSLGG